MTTQEVVPAAEQRAEPGDAVTVYEVISEPPLSAGAFHATVAASPPGVAATLVGALGMLIGVTDADGGDGGLVPKVFVAVMVTV